MTIGPTHQPLTDLSTLTFNMPDYSFTTLPGTLSASDIRRSMLNVFFAHDTLDPFLDLNCHHPLVVQGLRQIHTSLHLEADQKELRRQVEIVEREAQEMRAHANQLEDHVIHLRHLITTRALPALEANTEWSCLLLAQLDRVQPIKGLPCAPDYDLPPSIPAHHYVNIDVQEPPSETGGLLDYPPSPIPRPQNPPPFPQSTTLDVGPQEAALGNSFVKDL